MLIIHRPKKFLSAWSLCGPLLPSPQSKCPKRPSCYPKSIMLQFQMCSRSHLNVSYKIKTNINFTGQTWVRPRAKCWFKGFILPYKYHAPNFYRIFWHTLANNIAGYHLVSPRVISTPSDVQRVYKCSKRIFILPKKYYALVLNMLS